jgi:serine phosphatase RsbU (regulator of sigma subunit)
MKYERLPSPRARLPSSSLTASPGRNAQGEDYSDERLMALVRETRASSAAEICRNVLGDVHGFACGSQPCDDITLVVLKRMEI